MSKTINDYTAAVSVDATNDYFLLEQSGAYVRINRSIMLGITGSPVGTSDTQVLTNKTIGNTNAVTLKTNGFTLQDASDTTKQLIFSLSGVTTGTTRTLTVPNASATLATLTGVEVFTNKTLTSPVITGGSIDNATITVDSIAGHTSSTVVSVAGLQISSGVLNTANSVTATSIADGAIQPKALTTGTGSGWSWAAWTPSWTNLTVGNGTVTYAKYVQTGKTVSFRVKFIFGSTSAISGLVGVSLPVNLNADYSTASDTINTFGSISDVSTGDVTLPWATWGTSSRMDIYYANGNANRAGTSSTAPMTWATGDVLMIAGEYEAV